MKHTKKLIPAIGMLLLSACMLVTSTFAWFSMNTEVTATGMKVTAKADQIFLQINNQDNFLDNSSMTTIGAPTATASGSLYPTAVVESFDATAGTVVEFGAGSQAKDTVAWVKNYSSTVEDADAAGKYAAIGTVTDYYLVNTFYVRLNPSAGNTTALAPLNSSVTLKTTTSDLIAKSLSILVVCGTKAQLWKQTGENDAWVNHGDTALTTGNFTNATDNTSGAVAIQVYIFFDGDNDNCTTKNFKDKVTTEGYEVQVNFNVTPAQNG